MGFWRVILTLREARWRKLIWPLQRAILIEPAKFQIRSLKIGALRHGFAYAQPVTPCAVKWRPLN